MTEKPRLLIIGLGSIGERHLRCAQRLGHGELLACDFNAELRNKIGDQYKVRALYQNLDEAIAAGPTAAVVCVPAHLHISFAQRLIDAGVHVLIEKPLSTSLVGVAELRQSIERRGRIACVAYVNRANPNLAAMRAALASGRFGRPVQLVATAGQNFAFYRPAYRETYYADRATGGGAIQDALTHLINAGEWLVGPIDRVLADAAHLMVPGVEVEDTVHVLARHGTLLASYTLNQHQAPNEVTITANCERGTLRLELHANCCRVMTDPDTEWQDESRVAIERDELFITQLRSFFGAIEEGTPPLCTLDEGLQTLQVNLAILKSSADLSWHKISSLSNTS